MRKFFNIFRLPRPFAVYSGAYSSVPSYSVTGPSGGEPSTESTDFTVTFANLTGPVEVTFASTDPGGVFTPTSVTGDIGDLVHTFTYTPDATIGTHTLSWTNDGALTDPASIAYEVAVGGGTAGEAIGLLLVLTKAA